jgi:hypothetical protein
MKKELQQIIDNCSHPKAKQFFEHLFSKHDEIVELFNERAKEKMSEQLDVVTFDDVMLDWSDDHLDELGPDLLDRYKDKANAQLRRGTYASKFTKPAVQGKKRQNRLTGVKRATSRLDTFNNDEHANTTNEGLGLALDNAFKGAVTRSLATGLGVSASGLHKFGHDLIAKPKKYITPKPAAQKPAKPQHTQPAPTHSSTTWQPVELHHVFNGEPTEGERSLDQAITHHNIGSFAKSKGDNSKAKIHFRARDKHFKTYVTNAPRENLKKLNQDKVKRIFN